MAPDPQALKALEQEAAKYEKEDDFVSALDVYEEIVRKGWGEARHLLALGHCYLKNRQRQNAKTSWLRGVELNPSDGALRAALDHYFPNWESAGAATQISGPQPVIPAAPGDETKVASPSSHATVISSPGGMASPPPPPPRSTDPSASQISVQTTSTETRRPKMEPPQPRPKPAPPVQVQAQSPPAAVRRETRTDDTLRIARAAEPAAKVERGEARVNWNYVYEDAAEGFVVAPEFKYPKSSPSAVFNLVLVLVIELAIE